MFEVSKTFIVHCSPLFVYVLQNWECFSVVIFVDKFHCLPISAFLELFWWFIENIAPFSLIHCLPMTQFGKNKQNQSKQKNKTTIWSSKKFKIKWRDRLENEIIECFGEVGGIVSCPFECHSLLNLMALSSWPTKVMYYHLFAIKILKIEKKDI